MRREPDSSKEDPEYNLASRVYGGNGSTNGSNGNGNGATSNGRGDTESEAAFNLASRVYGPKPNDSHQNENGHANGDHEAHDTDEAPWNLAARVYGAPSPGVPANGSNGNGADGLSGTNGNGSYAAVATLAPAAAVAATNGASVAAAPAVEAERLGPPRGKFSIRTFESLNDRNFRWYFLAMFGQFFAMQMQMFVRGFLVFELTGSFAALGTVSLANAIPGLTLSLAGGVVADRLPKRVILQAGQVANMVMAGGITYLLFMNQLRFEHLLAAAVVQGISNAMTMPSRQSMVPELVGPARLMNAVALNTAGMNLTRLIAPALGGVIVALTSATGVYTFMTASYLFAVVTLLKVPAHPPFKGTRMRMGRGGGGGHRGAGGGSLRDLKEGLAYIVNTPVVRTLLLVNFLIVFVSMPYMMMLPGFAKDVLDTDATGLGILMSITGVGSLSGSLVIASLPSRHRGRLLLGGSMLLGAALLVFSASTVYWFSAAVMILIGVGQTTRMSLSNVLIQSYVEDEYRGRVMSVYMMEFSLTMFGVFAVGILAGIFGVQLVIGGTAVALMALVTYFFLFVPRIRNLD
jgi:MFS family permease